MVYPFLDLPSTYVPGEKKELSKQEKTGKWGTVESLVFLLVTPPITRVTSIECGTPKTKKVSETRDMVFLNRMYLQHLRITRNCVRNRTQKTLNQKASGSIRGGGTVTTEFDANDNGASAMDSVDSSVLDTPTVNSNPGWSKYKHTYECTTHYDLTTGRTIGAEATGLAKYIQCLKEADDDIQLTNVGASVRGGFDNTMELIPMKYKEAVNRPDGEDLAKKIKNEHNRMV
jgi:hypothetical protein